MTKIEAASTRITRRAVFGVALAAVTAAAAGGARALAQQMQTHMPPGMAPKPKGRLVFLDYDQDELDAAYNQAPWAPNMQAIDSRNAQKSAAARARLGPPRRLAYGPTEIERLYPVSLSARSSYVKFTKDVVEALSSQRHLDQLVAPVIVAHGTLETPEFQRQSREFAAAVKAAGKPVTVLVGQGYNHFEIQETMGNPYGLLGRAMLDQMTLRR